MSRVFTPGHLEFLRNHVVGRTKRDLTDLFNRHFQLKMSERQIVSCCKNNKLPPSGLDGRFKPGREPFNKGKTGVGGWEPTQFKKGHKPHNYKPVGTERINGDGYVDVKIADPNKWKGKHILEWEKENGPVPNGQVVIFGDGNRRNFDPNNLLLVTRKQLARLNQNHLISDNAEVTKTGLIIADIYSKIGERKKKNK
jgi:hypothetical protein